MGMTRLKYNQQPNVFFIRLFILILTFFFSRKDLIIFKGNINGWAHSTPNFYIFFVWKFSSVIKDDAEAWARSNEAKLTLNWFDMDGFVCVRARPPVCVSTMYLCDRTAVDFDNEYHT